MRAAGITIIIKLIIETTVVITFEKHLRDK